MSFTIYSDIPCNHKHFLSEDLSGKRGLLCTGSKRL